MTARALRHYAALLGNERAGVAKAIGDILRHARSAADNNLERGPGDDVAGHLRDVRAAADRALRLCECANGEARRC
jgi:hypothetical protein